MFFPFANYKMVAFNKNGINELVYTTTARCIITVEPVNTEIIIGGVNIVHVLNPYDGDYEDVGGSKLVLYNEGPATNPTIITTSSSVIQSGKQIFVTTTGHSFTFFQGILHVFELP